MIKIKYDNGVIKLLGLFLAFLITISVVFGFSYSSNIIYLGALSADELNNQPSTYFINKTWNNSQIMLTDGLINNVNNINSSEPINIAPSGDDNDYLQFYTDDGRPFINIVGHHNLMLESDADIGVVLTLYNDSGNYGYIGWDKTNNWFAISSTDAIIFNATKDSDDYIQFNTTNNIPGITTIGDCDLNITPTGDLLLGNDVSAHRIEMFGGYGSAGGGLTALPNGSFMLDGDLYLPGGVWVVEAMAMNGSFNPTEPNLFSIGNSSDYWKEGHFVTVNTSSIVSVGDLSINPTGDVDFNSNTITNAVNTDWDSAYGWGDHSGEGYLKNVIEDVTPQLGDDLDLNTHHLTSTGAINLMPSGDSDDYLQFLTDTNRPWINITGHHNLMLESDDADSVVLTFYENATHQGYIGWVKGGSNVLGLGSSGAIRFYPNSDTDDYLYTRTSSNIPRLGMIGTGVFYIQSDSASLSTIKFYDAAGSSFIVGQQKSSDYSLLQSENTIRLITNSILTDYWQFSTTDTVPKMSAIGGDGLITNIADPTDAQDAATKNFCEAVQTDSVLTSLGAQAEDLDMNTHKITGVTDPAAAQDASTKAYVDARLPTGAITAYGAAAAPTGWLLCDGAAVSRTTYATLFGVISTTYGVGDGSTTFNVPDLQGKFPAGYSGVAPFDALANTGGQKDAYLKDHSHFPTTRVWTVDGTPTHSIGTANVNAIYGTAETTAFDGDGTNGNLPPYLVINFIIKT